MRLLVDTNIILGVTRDNFRRASIICRDVILPLRLDDRGDRRIQCHILFDPAIK
jgi:hypothetical protein